MSRLGAIVRGTLTDLTGAVRGGIRALHVMPVHSEPLYLVEQHLTVSSSVVQLTVPADATMGYIQVYVDGIYYHRNQGTPSATVGSRSDAGDDLYIDGHNSLVNLRFIRQATDATLVIEYSKEAD